MADHVNQAIAGLDLDSVSHQIKEGWLSYAHNAMIENFDGNSVTYQNEQGNVFYVQLPTGYKVIGVKNIPELKQVYYFLTNPETRNSEIGWSDYGTSLYNTLISDLISIGKFNFSVEFPIHKIITKTTNCSTQLYWTEGLHNTMRWIDLTDLPWIEERNPNNAFKPIKRVGQLDPNKLRVQPDFHIPIIELEEVTTGGALVMGVYQFAVQYSNSIGDGYTSYFSVTNPASIWEDRVTPDFNLPTSKAIHLIINGLDVTGVYDFFNLAVVKTVNQTSSAHLVGTFPIVSEDFEYTYTGVETSPIQLSIEEIIIKYPHYDMAQDVYEVDHCIGWAGLYSDDEVNYQEIWNNVELLWETYQLPYNQFEGYTNGINSALYRGYMRDEVYAFEGYFLLKSGRQTKSFHIPGRIAVDGDIFPYVNNFDSGGTFDPCDEKEGIPRWKVYNTASAFTVPSNVSGDLCYVGPYQRGRMAFWESIQEYPNNPLVWGPLAGQKIRHHKFPDNGISPHFSNNPSNDKGFTHHIYPIGVKIRDGAIQDAIGLSSLTQAQKDDIIGFGIARGNRAGGNASIVAKGIFNNVGKYNFEDKEYLYANYPYNDLRPDPYFSKEKLLHHAGYRPDLALEGFTQGPSKSRFTFHSPDTHFTQPTLGDIMKIEGIYHGRSYGHFALVENNAEYKLMTREAYNAAAAVALASGMVLGAGTFGTPTYSLNGAPTVYESMLNILEKLVPWTNFGYSFNSIGFYNNFWPVPDDGFKVRHIGTAKYIIDGFQGAERGATINNFRRESAVYIHADDVKFPHEYDPSIPVDNSRYTITSYSGGASTLQDFYDRFVATNSEIITDTFIIEAMSQVSIGTSLSSLYSYTAVITYTGTVRPPYASYGPIPGTRYHDAYSNVLLTKYHTADPKNISDVTPLTFRNEWWSDKQVIGTQEPPNAAGTLTLDASNTVTSPPPLASIPYDTVGKIPSSQFYSQSFRLSSGFSPQLLYVQEIRRIFQLFILDRDNIDISSDETINDGWLFAQAAKTYYAAYSDYLSRLPKDTPTKERTADISCYYGSIKRTLLDQWGQMYSYQTISCGYYQELFNLNKDHVTEYPTVFGGDTFINQFSLKSKLALFIQNTVGKPNGADINYDELGNYGYPSYWLSTKPIDLVVDIADQAAKAVSLILKPSFGEAILAVLTGGGSIVHSAADLVGEIFAAVFKVLGTKNTNFDNYSKKNMYEEGIMYLFAYGLPTFFVESAINVEHRQAINETFGNYYPHIGNEIPDTWFQEVVTPIIHDNNYTYNTTYSKQNKEVFYVHLRESYDPEQKCFIQFPNRTFWSDKSQMEEQRNNWLIYRPASYFDFPKAYGKLVAVDGLENNAALVRYENKSQVYNSMVTIDTSTFVAFVGNDKLFSGAKPVDLAHTDIGSAGSQHKFLAKTEYGVVFLDSMRGQVLLLMGNQVENLVDKKVSRFLASNLPFKITETMPEVPIDNAFNGIGIDGVFDAAYKRLIITKLDYEPLYDIRYIDGKYYHQIPGWIEQAPGSAPPIGVPGETPIDPSDILGGGGVILDGVVIPKISLKGGPEVRLGDPVYFRDRSWTLSYNFDTQSWTSFHGYKPNFYIPYPTYFHTGLNSLESVWEHGTSFTLWNTFYDVLSPYVLEYPFIYKSEDEILASVQDYCSARIYTNTEIYYEPDEILYFNKAVIYNDSQCTGTLRLIPRIEDDLSASFLYPRVNGDSTEILVTRSDNFFQFNDFYNLVVSQSTPFFIQCKIDDKCLDSTNLDFSRVGYDTGSIRGKDCRIRLILDNQNSVKLISKFTIVNTQTSYK